MLLNTKYYLPLAVLSGVLVFVLTFYAMEADYATGLDSSYLWGLNYLFANDYDLLLNMVYPFGPLAFLKIPIALSHNFLLYIIFYYLVTFGFISLFFYIAKRKGFSILPTFVLCYLALILIRIDYTIVFLCAMLCFVALRERKLLFFALASLLAATGLCIKSSIGVEAIGVIVVSCLIDFYYNRQWKDFLLLVLTNLIVFLLVGCIVFKGFVPFFHYLYGVKDLVLGYGDSLALYPHNSWLYICIAGLLVLLSPLTLKDRDARIFLLQVLIPLYSTYKHAFVREDIYHYQQLIFFLLAFWAIMTLMNRKRALPSLVCGVICVACLYYNAAENIEKPEVITKNLKTQHIKNFYNYTFHLKSTEEYFDSLSRQAIKTDTIPQEWITLVGNSTVDCYPWEHLLAGANHLNWKPRRTLGTAISEYTSKVAQEGFDIDKGADFVIWHFSGGDKAKTFDDKYFLNDEPDVAYTLINNYTCIAQTDNCLLMKRNDDGKQKFADRIIRKSFTSSLNQWVDVEYRQNTILRLKTRIHENLAGKLKSMLFKGVAFYIDYQTLDGEVHSFRYTPNLAHEGLWINPFILDPLTENAAERVVRVRLRTNNDRYVRQQLELQFEELVPSAYYKHKEVKDFLF